VRIGSLRTPQAAGTIELAGHLDESIAALPDTASGISTACDATGLSTTGQDGGQENTCHECAFPVTATSYESFALGQRYRKWGGHQKLLRCTHPAVRLGRRTLAT